jgi:hypothetical protein
LRAIDRGEIPPGTDPQLLCMSSARSSTLADGYDPAAPAVQLVIAGARGTLAGTQKLSVAEREATGPDRRHVERNRLSPPSGHDEIRHRFVGSTYSVCISRTVA